MSGRKLGKKVIKLWVSKIGSFESGIRNIRLQDMVLHLDDYAIHIGNRSSLSTQDVQQMYRHVTHNTKIEH